MAAWPRSPSRSIHARSQTRSRRSSSSAQHRSNQWVDLAPVRKWKVRTHSSIDKREPIIVMPMNKILYVEDNYQNFRLGMRFLTLEKQQYDISQAPTGNDGLRMADEIKPDLIL